MQYFACEGNYHRRSGNNLSCNNALLVANIIFKIFTCTTMKSLIGTGNTVWENQTGCLPWVLLALNPMTLCESTILKHFFAPNNDLKLFYGSAGLAHSHTHFYPIVFRCWYLFTFFSLDFNLYFFTYLPLFFYLYSFIHTIFSLLIV